MNKSKPNNKSKNKAIYNKISSLVFTPIKRSKNYASVFMWLSLFLIMCIIVSVFTNETSFSQEELREAAEFTLNLVFVVSALGLAIFTLPIKNCHPEKDKIMLSYIGTSLLLASIAIFTYILSFCPFLNFSFYKVDLYTLYFCVMLVSICRCISSIISAVVACFNIR